MKFNNIRVTVLAFIAFGNALSLLGQTTIFEEARYGPNNANGSNNPDFAYGSGISATLSSIKSTAPGFPVPADSSSCRFFGASGTANSWFTVTPSGTNQLTVGQSYAVGITFGNNTAAGQNQNSNIVVNITDSGTTGIDTVAGLSSVFATNTTPVNTWGTIGHVTINSATPSFTFTWASGFTNNRWYVDTVRFVPLGTVGTAQYWDTGSIGGTGAWDATSLNWNPNSDGSGTPATYSPVGLAVFGGAPGTVSVDPGGVTVNGGMQFDVSGYTVQGGTLTLGTAPFIWITNGASVAINCALSGTNGLVLPVAGTLTLGAPVTSLTGRVTLAGGTTLTLSPSGSQNFSSLTGGGALNIGAATLTVGSDNSTTTYAGILSDGGSGNPGALVKAGTGILILGGANTYAGSTTISGGQINVNADAALGTAPASLDPSHLTLDDGTCLYSAKTGGSVLTLSANRGITLNGNTTISGNTAAKEITFNCPITGSGSLSLPCTWPDFNATNSFAGDLILNMTNGSVSARFNVNNCAGAGRVHVFPQLNAGNDTITIRNNTASGATLTNGFFFDESVSHSPGYYLAAYVGSTFALSGNIIGTATGGISINDSTSGNSGGTLALSGNNSGFTNSAFNLEGGTLLLGNPLALGTGWLVVRSGGIGGFSPTLQASIPLTGASALTNTVYLNLANGFTINGSNPIEFAGPFHLGASATVELDTPTTISGNIDDQGFGLGLLLTSGSGSTLLLSGNNSYRGGTTIFSGTVEGATSNSIAGDVLLSGGTLQLDNPQAMRPGSTLTINGGSVNLNFTGYQTNFALIYGGVAQTNGIYNASSPGFSGILTGPGNLVVSQNFVITSEALDQTETNLVVCWESAPGQNYDVLTNSSVTMPANWAPINPTAITATNYTTCYTLPGGIANSNAFIRVRLNQ